MELQGNGLMVQLSFRTNPKWLCVKWRSSYKMNSHSKSQMNDKQNYYKIYRNYFKSREIKTKGHIALIIDIDSIGPIQLVIVLFHFDI